LENLPWHLDKHFDLFGLEFIMRRLKIFFVVPVLVLCLVWFCYRDQVLEIFFSVWRPSSTNFDEAPSLEFVQSSPASHESKIQIPELSNATTTTSPELPSIPVEEVEPVDYTDPLDRSRNLFYGSCPVTLLTSRAMASINPRDSYCRRGIQHGI
jgi:hypothetical protein